MLQRLPLRFLLAQVAQPEHTSGIRKAVLVIEDDAIVRDWVRRALEGSEFRVAGVAWSSAEVGSLVGRRKPDLLLVEYRLGDGLGTELVRELRRSGFATPAILMTANAERGLNEAARGAGAQGTLLKTASLDELMGVLRTVAAGGSFFDPRHPRGQAATLTPREREVLALIARGATNREAAEGLGIGPETVKTLLERAYAKLGVRRRSEAVAAAYEAGLL